MEFKEVLEKRYSCRDFSDRAVDIEIIKEIIRETQLSPSAMNMQPWHFIAVHSGEALVKARECFGGLSFNKFVKDAPVLTVIIKEKNLKLKTAELITGREFGEIDVGIAAAVYCMSAADKGLSTCILGAFKANKIKEALNIPKNKDVALIIATGYAAAEGEKRKSGRKEFEKVFSENFFRE